MGTQPESEPICRGTFSLGTACGRCQKCKAQAFDWLCECMPELDYWAVMVTGTHDVMKAIKHATKVV